MLGQILCLILLITSSYGEDFKDLLKGLESHQLVVSKEKLAGSIEELSFSEGSWGDPMVDVAAVNFPRDTLNRDASMMTGIRFGISQSINISGKYGKLQESIEELATSKKANGLQLKRQLAKTLWELASDKLSLNQMKGILKENLAWVKGNLKISKRLYANGKVPQQAVLDIQMRKSQLESDIANIDFSLRALKQNLSYLLATEEVVDLNLSSVPWDYLEDWKNSKGNFDYKEKELEHILKASDLKVSAKNRNFIPDIKLGFNYTKRNDLDRVGDFVGASITIPIPTSSKRYADKSQALLEKLAAEKNYRHYKRTKPRLLEKMKLEIGDHENQLKILVDQTLKYAKSSRDVIARSYARGGADYLELLRSELQYQNQLIKKVNLETNLKKKKIDFLFIKGDDLLTGSQS